MKIIFIIASVVLGLIVSIFLFHRFIFLRDPHRVIPSGKVIVSPADGKIIAIKEINNTKERVSKGNFGKIYTLTEDTVEEGYLISIFMSPFNVHINRAPIAGRVEKINYKKGKFLPVNTLESGLVNEKNEIIINNKEIGKVKVIQIAGFLARRIECFVKEKQQLNKGERFGLINLGSQVTLIIPKNVTLKVKEGEKVKGGETIIAGY